MSVKAASRVNTPEWGAPDTEISEGEEDVKRKIKGDAQFLLLSYGLLSVRLFVFERREGGGSINRILDV